MQKLKTTQIDHWEEEELACDIDLSTIFAVINCYERRGDYSGAIERIRRFGRLPLMAPHIPSLLHKIIRLYEDLAETRSQMIAQSVERLSHEL